MSSGGGAEGIKTFYSQGHRLHVCVPVSPPQIHRLKPNPAGGALGERLGPGGATHAWGRCPGERLGTSPSATGGRGGNLVVATCVPGGFQQHPPARSQPQAFGPGPWEGDSGSVSHPGRGAVAAAWGGLWGSLEMSSSSWSPFVDAWPTCWCFWASGSGWDRMGQWLRAEQSPQGPEQADPWSQRVDAWLPHVGGGRMGRDG